MHPVILLVNNIYSIFINDFHVAVHRIGSVQDRHEYRKAKLDILLVMGTGGHFAMAKNLSASSFHQNFAGCRLKNRSCKRSMGNETEPNERCFTL